jgi:secreted trypsin-like serine protease
MNRLGLLALVVAGCTAPAGIGTSEQPIIGGTNDSGDPGVVLVIAQVSGSQSASLCTGEVVSPHVVMTAAHCVDPSVVGMGNTFSVYIGDDINTQPPTSANIIAGKETHFDSQFSTANLGGGHDVGVVITTKAIPRPSLPMNKQALSASLAGTNMRIVGYGISSGTDTMGTTAGTKRQTMVGINQITSKFIDFGDSVHNSCEGDSGGPAFIDLGAGEVIVGLTSFGPQGCTSGGTDTRVDVYAAPFVDPYIQMFDNGMTNPAPDMAQPANPDMATGGGGGGGTPAPGTVGATCSNNSDCQSNVCAKDGDTGYCTKTCDPNAMDACPMGLSCGVIDNTHYCVKSSGTGCDFAGGGVPGGMLVLVLFVAAGFVSRRRRA